MVVIVMCCVMYVTVLFIGAPKGIFVSMLFYWFGLCWPLAYYFQGSDGLRANLSLALHGKSYIAWLVLGAAVVAGVYAFATLPNGVPWEVFLLAPIFGIINGTAEEVYWRGAYLTIAKKSKVVWSIGLILFAAWHFAFIFPGELSFVGGPAALISGAFGAGVFWMLIVWQTNHIGWTVVSHILFNSFLFVELIAQNFA